MIARALIAVVAAVILSATGCAGGDETSANTPEQVKQAFAAEGIELGYPPWRTSPEDHVTSFTSANENDGVMVSVYADHPAAEKYAGEMMLMAQVGTDERPFPDLGIVRAGNVVVVRAFATPPQELAAAKRAMKRLRGPTSVPDLARLIPGGIPDPIAGGVDHLQSLLDDHPFPAGLAPGGFRFRSDTADFDGRETHGRTVRFDGPDDEDTITYYPHAMDADDVLRYWKRTESDLLAVDNLGSHSYCATDDPPVTPPQNRVTCVAAFDGMAVIAESLNDEPGRGSRESAVALLQAGVAHWKAIRD